MILLRSTFLLLLLMLFCVPLAAAEYAPLRGQVIDEITGDSLPGVTVESSDGRIQVTDLNGFFTIDPLDSNILNITFTLPGYTTLSQQFESFPTTQKPKRIKLKRLPTYKDTVEVVEVSVPQIEPVMNVTPEYVIRAPGAFEDTLQSLQVMPGVIGGDDYSARLFVRGGRPDQNGIYLDNIPIYDPYRLFGLTSLFNPETIDRVKLIPGGFDARYGDRLSSIIEVENRHGTLDERFKGSANISLTNTNISMEGKLLNAFPSSWMVSARRTYYDLIIKATDPDASSYPSFTDLQTLVYLQPTPRNQWFITLMACDESTDLSEDEEDPDEGIDPDHYDVVDDQKNYIAGINGSHLITDTFLWSYSLSFTENEQISDILLSEGETSFDTKFDQSLTSENYRLSSTVEWYTEHNSMIAGVELTQSDNLVKFSLDTDDPRVDFPDDLLRFSESQDYRKSGAFLQNTWEFVPGVQLKTGLRWDESTLSDMSEWSPRVSLHWTPREELSVRAAWGHYYQFPSYESLQGDGYFLDLRGIKDLQLKPEKATHYMLSSQYESKNGWSLEMDIYYKDLQDLIYSGEEEETVLILNDDGTTSDYIRDSLTWDPENNRNGYARGIDITCKLHDTDSRPYYGMLTYTFCQAKSRKTGETYAWESWDRRHSLTWLAGWKLNDQWELGWKWRVASGFPYTPLTNIIRVVEDEDGDGMYEPEDGETFTWQRDDPDSKTRSERFPVYHRLDFRVQFSPRTSWFDADLYLDIINIYGSKNVQSYDYNADFSQRDEEEGMPFVPSLGVKLRF